MALLTGCRAGELTLLRVDSVDKGAVGFDVEDGKTENARRYVPVPECLQPLLSARLESVPSDGRVFPEWPVRPSSGKCSALSQSFTRYRRKVLGEETNTTHVFHSFRHTWRTMARRALVPDPAVNQLGGWAGVERSDSTYDHGLDPEGLRKVQEQIAERLREEGYLEGL